jgi:hypothetical protein
VEQGYQLLVSRKVWANEYKPENFVGVMSHTLMDTPIYKMDMLAIFAWVESYRIISDIVK